MASPTSQRSDCFDFLSLPRELRDHIYSYIFRTSSPITLSLKPATHPSHLSASRPKSTTNNNSSSVRNQDPDPDALAYREREEDGLFIAALFGISGSVEHPVHYVAPSPPLTTGDSPEPANENEYENHDQQQSKTQPLPSSTATAANRPAGMRGKRTTYRPPFPILLVCRQIYKEAKGFRFTVPTYVLPPPLLSLFAPPSPPSSSDSASTTHSNTAPAERNTTPPPPPLTKSLHSIKSFPPLRHISHLYIPLNARSPLPTSLLILFQYLLIPSSSSSSPGGAAPALRSLTLELQYSGGLVFWSVNPGWQDWALAALYWSLPALTDEKSTDERKGLDRIEIKWDSRNMNRRKFWREWFHRGMGWVSASSVSSAPEVMDARKASKNSDLWPRPLLALPGLGKETYGHVYNPPQDQDHDGDNDEATNDEDSLVLIPQRLRSHSQASPAQKQTHGQISPTVTQEQQPSSFSSNQQQNQQQEAILSASEPAWELSSNNAEYEAASGAWSMLDPMLIVERAQNERAVRRERIRGAWEEWRKLRIV